MNFSEQNWCGREQFDLSERIHTFFFLTKNWTVGALRYLYTLLHLKLWELLITYFSFSRFVFDS